MNLIFKCYFTDCLFGEATTTALHRLLQQSLPKWCADLRVLKHEDRAVGQRVDDSLLDAIEAEAPVRWGIGNAILNGTYEGLVFYLTSCESTLPPELNVISIEILRDRIEGQPAEVWASSFFHDLARQLRLRYARVCLRDEFYAKNIVADENGVRAIGVRIANAIPGLYWLNYFGRDCSHYRRRHTARWTSVASIRTQNGRCVM